VSVNLPGLQLLDPQLEAEVAAARADSGLSPASRTLEITETVLVQDVPAAVDRLEALRALVGCTLGQGYLFARPLVADDVTALLAAPSALAA
jgi:EAL domain-containing protein (putative c-di-GMP-specific phosphodiesterase class I)